MTLITFIISLFDEVRRVLILLSLTLFLGSTINAYQGGGGESTKTPLPKPKAPPSKDSTKKVPRPPTAKKNPTSILEIKVDVAESEIFLTDQFGNNATGANTRFTGESLSPLRIANLRPGTYTLLVRKSGFYDHRENVNLNSAVVLRSTTVRLRPSTGSLTVTSNTTDARLEVNGMIYFGKSPLISLPSGEVRITATKAGYEPIARLEHIQGGEIKRINIILEPIRISDRIAAAEQKFKDKDYDNVLLLCDEILKIEPNNSKANLFSGLALSGKGQYHEAMSPLFQAVTKGETIKFVVARRRAQMFDEGLQFGLLELTSTTISFLNAKSAFPETVVSGEVDFSVPYSKIDTLKIENYYNRYGYAWRVFTKVKVPKENGKDDKKDFAFYTSKAKVDRFIPQGQKYYASRIRCDNCIDEAQFIFNLIEALKNGRLPQLPTLRRRTEPDISQPPPLRRGTEPDR